MAVLVVPPYLQFFDPDQPGVPLAGGLVYTYAAGTNTPKATYTDNTEGVVASNPIVMDSAGRCTIWGNGSYKFVVTDALGNVVDTTDGVTTFSVPAVSANSFFQSFSGDGATTTFTLSHDLGTDENSVLIFVDQGAGEGYDAQNPNAFTLVGGGSPTITFASAPAVGTNNIYCFAPSLLLGAASTSAAAAASSATAASASAVLASQWASQTTGIVAATDYSAKAWAIGGTGVTGASGASKEWSTKTSATVDGTLFSAKEYAQGTQASTGGSAKNWSQQTGADVTGAASQSRSAKSWAQEDLHGATYGGSAKDWAQSASFPDGTNKSSKSYAADAQTSATASAASASTASAAAAAASAAAIGLANEWIFSSSILMTDPGAGNFRIDNAVFGLVSNLAISALSGDTGNPNLRTFIQTWDDSNHSPRGIIRIEKNATNFIILGVNGALTDNTTWLQIPVTVIASAGSFSLSDVTFIQFTPYGNDGTGTGNVSTSGTITTTTLALFNGSTTIQSLVIGTNLSITGNTLNASGGSGATSINGLSDAYYDTTTGHNIVLGSKLTFFSGAQFNLFVGEGAGAGVTAGSSATTDNNIGIGYQALTALTTARQNTAIGVAALSALTTASFNTAVGYNAMKNSGLGAASNVAIGAGAMTFSATVANNTGGNNVAIGTGTLGILTSGAQNTVIGSTAGQVIATSNASTLIGYNAAASVTGGSNTMLGSSTANTLTTGANNTCLGASSDVSSSSASNRTSVGSNSSCTADNSVQLGDSNVTVVKCGTSNTASVFALNTAKATAKVTGATGSRVLSSGFNVTSVTDNAIGDISLVFTTSFANTNYVATALAEFTSTTLSVANDRKVAVRNAGQATGSIRLQCSDSTVTTNATKDPQAWHFAAFGTQ